MNIPNWTKYFLPLSLVITVCAASSACKPGGETAEVVISTPILFGTVSDLRALLVSESNDCLYVADHNQRQIHCVSLTTHSINEGPAFSTLGKPLAMALARDAAQLVIATEEPAAVEVIVIATKSRQSCTFIGTPTSVAVSSNNQIYVGVGDSPGSIYSCGTVAVPIQSAASIALLSGYNRIAGQNHSGTLMVMVSKDMSLATLWDTQAELPNNISTQDLFGASAKYGHIVFRPEDREAYVLTDGSATDGNFLPVFSVDATTRQLTSITSALQPAFIPNSLVFLQAPQRAVMTHAAEPVSWATNQDKQTDLHIFDTDTGEELGRYNVGDYVRKDGLAADQRNVIYMLLGEKQATSVGIVTAP